jgi:hypothetical protein
MWRIGLKVLMFAGVLLTLTAMAAYLWRLAPLLPASGGTVCFAGKFDVPRPVHIQSFGYSQERGRFTQQSMEAMTAMRVRIKNPASTRVPDGARTQADSSYIISFHVEAVLAGGLRLSTAASCQWGNTWVDQIVPELACFIDCEGGSVSAWRKAGGNSLSVWFKPREHLRMVHGCGDSGNVFIGAATEALSFPVEPVAEHACTNL